MSKKRANHTRHGDRPVHPASFGREDDLVSKHRVYLALCLATLLAKSLIFAPISLWPLSFVCLVPWLILVGGAKQAPRVYAYSFGLGLAFYLFNMRWLYPSTGAGYVALSFYQAAYWPLIACPVRSVVRRRRWPLAVVFPFVWVGGEMLRAVVISGFPWFYLSHSLYGVTSLIQISDLVGAYGVSFVVAAANGAVADVWLARRFAARQSSLGLPRRRVLGGCVWAASILVVTLLYGLVQLQSDTSTPGPRVAVLQGDFLSSVGGDKTVDVQKRRIYFEMMDEAATQHPDLYLLPETPWQLVLNPETRDFIPLSRSSFQSFQNRATRNGAVIVTGSGSIEPTPSDLRTTERRYNSATVFYPDAREPGRYDKIHLVYFGETVPFRFGRWHSVYLWLNRIMPFSGEDGNYEYSLFRGSQFRVFDMKPASLDGQTVHFGVPICYEDVMPYVSREFVGGGNVKRADFLLNISNDGWFGRGVQQPQHLAICVFRAVENRVGIARAVNTGISGFIDPTGRVHDLVKSDHPNRWGGQCGFSVAQLSGDSRYTLYTRYGDWFGWTCAAVWLMLFLDYWVVRWRSAE